jgi:hypothetical protein
MNERIKELGQEAGLLMHNPDGLPTKLEKFAELIVRDTLDQVAEFGRLTRAYQTQGIDPEIDVTREVLKNYGFTRFPRS